MYSPWAEPLLKVVCSNLEVQGSTSRLQPFEWAVCTVREVSGFSLELIKTKSLYFTQTHGMAAKPSIQASKSRFSSSGTDQTSQWSASYTLTVILWSLNSGRLSTSSPISGRQTRSCFAPPKKMGDEEGGYLRSTGISVDSAVRDAR